MDQRERDFVLAQIEAWASDGLIDEGTRARLRDHCTETELEQRAEEIVAADPAPEPPLEQALAQEVAAVQRLGETIDGERSSRAARGQALERTPPAVRRPAPGVVAATLPSPALEEGPLPAVDALVQRESRWASAIRPFLYENALWIAGGLLIIVGSLYFLRLVWDDLSSVLLHALIAAALHGYAGGFFAAGYVLSRRRQAHGVGRILFCFTLGLLPLASVATGELLVQLAPVSWSLALVAAAIALLLQAVLLTIIAGLYERAAVRPMLAVGLWLALLTLAIGSLAGAGRWIWVVAPLGLVGAGALRPMLVRSRVNLRATILLLGGAALWSLMVLVGRLQLVHPIDFSLFAVLIAAVAALLIDADHRLRERTAAPARLSALAVALHGGLLVALALALCGLWRLGYFSIVARLNVLGVALIAALCFGQAALRHGRSAMTQLAATAGLLSYFFLPAPFVGLLRLVQSWVHAALGYQDQPLPLAYYGLTFVPFLVAVTWLAARLRARRADLSRDLQRFVLVVSGLVCVLAATSGQDIRPLLWTWPIYGVGAFVGARLFGARHLRVAGHLLLIASGWALGARYQVAPGLPVAAYALVVAVLLQRWPVAWHLLLGAAVAWVVGAAGLFFAAKLSTALVGAVLLAAAGALIARRTGSRLAGHGAAAATLVAVLLAWAHWQLGATALVTLLLAHAGAAAALGAARQRWIAEPAVASGTASAVMGTLAALLVAPLWGGLAATAVLTALVLRSGSWLTTGIAALSGAVALCGAAATLWPEHWPLLLGVLATTYLWLGGRPASSWSPRCACALRWSSLAVLFAFVSIAGRQAVGGALRLDWLAWICSGGALFLLAVAARWRGSAAGRAAALGLAASSTLAAALALQHLLQPSAVVLPWAHAVLLALLGLGWGGLARIGRAPWPAELSRAVCATLVALSLAPYAWVISTWVLDVGHQLSLLPVGARGWLPPAAVAAAALGAWLNRAQLGPFAPQALLAGLALLAVAIWSAALPGAHATVPLAAVALLVALRGGGPRLDGQGASEAWPVSLAGLALMASHGHLHGPLPLVGCAALAVTLGLADRRATAGRGWGWAWSVALAVAIQCAVIWVSALLSTGRYPEATVLVPMAACALLTPLALRAAGRSGPACGVEAVAGAMPAVAAALASLALGTPAALPLALRWVALGLLALAITWLARRGLRRQQAWSVHLAWLFAVVLYLGLRAHTALSAAGPWLDAAVVLGASQLALWLTVRGQTPAARRPARLVAVGLPVLGLVPMLQFAAAGAALFSLLLGLHYGIAARQLASRALRLPAFALGNVALFCTWATLGWSDLQLYTLPIGVTLLAVIQAYGEELGEAGRRSARNVVLLALYTLAVGEALVAAGPTRALVLVPLLSVAGIVVGTLLRIRSYVLMATAFLAADLLLTMARYGLSSRALGALFLTGLGLLVVGAMVVFSLERERILRRYSSVLTELRTWD